MKWSTLALTLVTSCRAKGQQHDRRLDARLQAFNDRCAITSTGKGYVDCDSGFVVGVGGVTTSQTCVDACGNDASGNGDDCCTGLLACGRIEADGTIIDGFTGKGKSKVIHVLFD